MTPFRARAAQPHRPDLKFQRLKLTLSIVTWHCKKRGKRPGNMHGTAPKSALPSVFCALLALGCASSALADETAGDLLHEPFTVSLGTFLLQSKTTFRLDGSAGTTGTSVDLKKDLGLRDSDRFRVDAAWRFAERHRLRAMYFSTSQSRTRSLERDVTIRDTVYPVAAQVTTENSWSIAELAYEYVFMRRDNYEVAGTIGVHSLSFKLAVSGNGSVANQSAQFTRESATTQAPLPLLGLRGLWQFHPQWYLEGQAQYFALKISDYDGHLSDVRVGVTRMFGSHLGVGAGWNEFITDVKINRTLFDGSLNWHYSGAQVYLTAAF
jgi:hypothetical protein